MKFRFEVDPVIVGERLDAAIAARETSLSRAQARRLVDAELVRVSGQRVKPSHRLREGELVEGTIPPPKPDMLEAEAIPLDIVFEDDDLIVVNKPAGMVVHPAVGHATGTLVHALLHHCGELSNVGGLQRPGIVHRIDKDTSGLLVASKNDLVHRSLGAQFKAHSIEREYLALVCGLPKLERGTVNAMIGRHPTDRKRFSTNAKQGKDAVTHWAVEKRFEAERLALLRVKLETGRTHQIRVHLASIDLPVAGDPTYGGGRKLSRALGLERQALHATVLGFEHPTRKEHMRFEASLPNDLVQAIRRLDSA